MPFPRLVFVLLIVAPACTSAARVPPFSPAHYQKPDGALVVLTDGNFVEPYFAAKALLAAEDGGLDVREASLAWIQWMLPRQRRDGRFDRYCLKPGGQWRACGHADADDSMLALWLQLLYRMAPDSGLPPQWQQSAAHAQRHLASLRNHAGVYHISHRNHVGLFMDNVEVYSALGDISKAQARFGEQQASAVTARSAQELAASIQRVFWDSQHNVYRPSTQKERRGTFYPDAVAQTYPWLAGLPTPARNPRAAWTNWRQIFGEAWLQRTQDPHPWGLLALTADKMGDEDTAVCWLEQSEPFRYSKDWNILEEAVYQALEARLAEARTRKPSACSEVMARR